MASRRTPTILDAVVVLTHRRDFARGKAEAAEAAGQTLHAMCWRLVETEVLNLSGYLADDELWLAHAEMQRVKLERQVATFEAHVSGALALPAGL